MASNSRYFHFCLRYLFVPRRKLCCAGECSIQHMRRLKALRSAPLPKAGRLLFQSSPMGLAISLWRSMPAHSSFELQKTASCRG